MATKREQILSALHNVLAGIASARVERGTVLPERIPAGGIVILRDGDPGDPDVTLSPLQYHWQHLAEAEVIVQGKTPADRDAAFDALLEKLAAVIAVDRTLGGLCDWVEAEAPKPADLPIEGAQALKAAVVAVTLHYTTSDPLA